mgnify:CR=1 FL=1
MNLIERVKNILIAPQKEWAVIRKENDSPVKVLTSYLILLALIPTAAAFVGWGFVGYKVYAVRVASVELGIRYGAIQFVSVITGAYLTAFVLDLLAPNYGAEKGFDRAFQLSAYCYTAFCVAGVFYLLPSLSTLASLAALYSLYLLYAGLKPMMKVPDEKAGKYFIAALLCMIAVSVVLSLVLGAAIGLRGITHF